MAHLNIKERVIETKVVYYGAGLSGKTTNLEQIKRLSVGGKCGELMSVDTDGDRTLFFDWLPMQIGKFNGCDVKVQLFTVPGQAKYAETRKKVLAGADGVVLVLDSQSGALERNVQVLNDLRDHLREHKLESLPIVVQLNKRDLPTALPIDELLSFVGVGALPHVPASAATGEGVFETLREMIRHVLMHVRDQARDSSGDIRAGSESALDGHTLYGQISDGMANAPALAVRPEAPGKSVGKPDVQESTAATPAAAPAPPAAVKDREAEADRGTLVSMEARSFAPAAKVANGATSHTGARPFANGSEFAGNGVARDGGPTATGARPFANGSEFAGNGSAAPDRFTDVAARAAYSSGVAPSTPARDATPRPAESSPSLRAADGPRETQLSEIIASSRQVLRRVDHVEAQMEKAVANGFVDLERKLLGRLGDALAERMSAKLEGALSPLAARFEGLEGAVAGLAKTQGDLAQLHDALAKEVGRVASRLNELATDTTATKDATGRHVARLADLAVELGGLKDLSSGLEARATERLGALETSIAAVGKGVERVAGLEASVASIGKGVERVASLEAAVARLGTDILRLASVETAVASVAKEIQPLGALAGKVDGVSAGLETLRTSQAHRQELIEGAVAALTHELQSATGAASTFHEAVAGHSAASEERLGKLEGALGALVAEQQRLAEVLKGAADAARTSVTEQRLGIARVEEAVGKGSSTIEALVRAASDTVSAQIEKANRMQDAASKGTVQRLVDLSTAIRDLDGRVGNELGGVVHASNELSKIVGAIEARVSQNFSLAVNQIGKLVEGQTATLQRGTMGLVADVGLAKNVLDELSGRLDRIGESVHGIKGLGDDVRRVTSSVDGGSAKQQALLQETFDQTRTRLDVMGERVARITEVMNELSAEMKKPKGWFRG